MIGDIDRQREELDGQRGDRVLVLSALVLVHELGHFLAPGASASACWKFSIGSGRASGASCAAARST